MTVFHLAARYYTERLGWHVFPCEPNGKRPLTPNGKDDATSDPEQVDAWWTRWPNANIGIAVEPSGLVVADYDIGAAKDGLKTRVELGFDRWGTRQAKTGGGGLHEYFTAPQGTRLGQRIGIRPGLDLISRGYVIAPPSVHASGSTYDWLNEIPPLPLPDALRELTHERKEIQPSDVGLQLGPGQRNNGLFALGAELRRAGLSIPALYDALHCENRTRCSPPLDDTELKAIIESVANQVQPSYDAAQRAVVRAEIMGALVPSSLPPLLHELASQDLPPQRCYSLGMPALDKFLGGGVHNRQVTALVAPPSCGKSALVGTWGITLQHVMPVLHVSTELPRDEVMVRYAALVKGFPWRDGMTGQVPRGDMLGHVKGLRIFVQGQDDIDREDPIGKIRRDALQIAEKTKQMPAIIVDYVQLLARGAGDDIRTAVGDLTLALRRLSQELDTPIIAVFSTGRMYYGRNKNELLKFGDDPTAYLATAKESGDIEFDCATLMYADVDQLAVGLPKPARIVVARCRVGDVGFAGARVYLDSGRWVADESALSVMTSESRLARDGEDKLEANAEKLIRRLKTMRGRPWREIRKDCGMRTETAEEVKQYLMDIGRIKYGEEVTHDPKTNTPLGKGKAYAIIEVVDNPPPTSKVGLDVPTPPEEE